ncbi:LacI family DNA-binding transcriptional regulator [Geofilum rubicundum]|uniref:LacI family transcriptional regulator n=1 Tax=Geofilum rubicundum JCM 15548 TaxID=1236989 RepID=A0A0E9LY79_9BACT|nr:LacI family DNA-binding transcriptional regulator [Geofilum rubicundum]GAO29830.1 LacI family transcriptional regulator [Geofilum rubicundum JCM 15548]
MPASNVTINDIARELKVAPSTISRALNNKSQISEKTKKMVRQKAAELGYDINLVASGLSKNKSTIIGVLLPNINRYFFSQVVSGIESVANDKGYQIIIAQTNESLEREIEVARMFNSTVLPGLLPACRLRQRMFLILKSLRKMGSLLFCSIG